MKKRKKQTEVFCPYCGRRAVLRPITYVVGENRRIFDPDQMVYVCSAYPACNAYVAANKKNLRPLGSLADGRTEKLAHPGSPSAAEPLAEWLLVGKRCLPLAERKTGAS